MYCEMQIMAVEIPAFMFEFRQACITQVMFAFFVGYVQSMHLKMRCFEIHLLLDEREIEND